MPCYHTARRWARLPTETLSPSVSYGVHKQRSFPTFSHPDPRDSHVYVISPASFLFFFVFANQRISGGAVLRSAFAQFIKVMCHGE